MTFSMEYAPVSFLKFFCFSNILAVCNQVVIENPSKITLFPERPSFSEDSLPNVSKYHSHDFMVLDAVEATTPAVCTPGMTCGFQQYEQDVNEYIYHPLIRYCQCPEDYACVEHGQNMKSRFFYYTCQYVPRPENATVMVDTSVSNNSSNGVTHNLSAVSTETVTESEINSPNRMGSFSDASEL